MVADTLLGIKGIVLLVLTVREDGQYKQLLHLETDRQQDKAN